MRYEGWVPNATGNLSFTAIGESLKNSSISEVVARQQLSDTTRRWFICAQKRKNPDAWLYTWILYVGNRVANWFRSPSRRRLRFDTLTYVMTGATEPTQGNEEGRVVGCILILSPFRTSLDASMKALKAKADDLAEASATLRSGGTAQAVTGTWAAFENDLASRSIFACNFTLLRNGKCFIDARGGSSNGPAFKLLVDQCYYFLKDCVHSHYHHNSKTDAILEVVPVARGRDWRLKVLRNLYRKIIFLRKLQNINRLADALGILAYATNFSSIFSNSDFNEFGVRCAKPALPEQSDALEKSISLIIEKIKAKHAQRLANVQYVVATVLSAAALYVSLAQNFDAKSPGKTLYTSVATYLSNHPYFLLWTLLASIMIYFAYIWSNKGAIAVERSTYRIMAWLGKGYYIALGAGASLALGMIAYYLLSFVAAVPFIKNGQPRPETLQSISKIFGGPNIKPAKAAIAGKSVAPATAALAPNSRQSTQASAATGKK